jgi:integrase
LGGYKLTEISPILIEKYKLKRKQSVSTETVNKELSILRRIFNVAISWDKCKSNPVNKVKFFQQPPPKERILTLDEENSLLNESPKHLRAILITALHTGMRRGEILNLKWADIDHSNGYIHVRKSKSGNGRKIPINETLRETLLELQSQNFVSNSVSSNFLPAEKAKDYKEDTQVTNCLEGAVPVRACGFNSRLRHHELTDYVFMYKGKGLKKIRNAFLLACKRAGIKTLDFRMLDILLQQDLF